MIVRRPLPLLALAALVLLAGFQSAPTDRWKPERRHPGYLMQVDYVPTRDAFPLGGPVEVTLRITNVGAVPFRFMRGGRQRGARDNQFAFTCQFGTRMLCDTGDPINFGGLAAYVAVAPGESVEIPVDLVHWFTFEETGTYDLRGSYAMSFADPNVDPREAYTHIWEDFAAGAFSITMRENDDDGG